MRGISYLILFHLMLTGCKKDKLEGEKDVLVGAWKHIYTLRDYTYQNKTGFHHKYSIIYPSDLGYDARIVFEKRGIISLYQSNEVINKGRIVFSKFVKSNDFELDKYNFRIYINNKRVNELSGIVSTDTLITSEFSLSTIDKDAADLVEIFHKNYFIRE